MRSRRSLSNSLCMNRMLRLRRIAVAVPVVAGMLAFAAPPAQAQTSVACNNALLATQNAVIAIAPIAFGSGIQSIDAPGLTLAERQARTQALCTSVDFSAAAASFAQVREACGDNDLGMVLDLSEALAPIQQVLNMACVQFQGEYCLPKFYQVAENGLSSTPTAGELGEFCDPCVRRVFATLAALSGGNAHSSAMSTLETVCLKQDGEFCLPQFNAFAAAPPPDIGDYVDQFCSNSCLQRMATRLYPPGTPNPFAALGVCDRDPADNAYCLPRAVQSLTTFNDDIASGSISVANTIDCVPGPASTCALSGDSCSGHDDCADSCSPVRTCLGGSLDGTTCSNDAGCSETCVAGTCSRTGGACSSDSGCPERAIPCIGRCSATAEPCHDDSECADRSNSCSGSVCGHATTTRCSSDAECPSGPCLASFCFDTSGAQACSDRSDCSGAGSAESLNDMLRRVLAGFGCCEHSVAVALNKSSPAVVWPYEGFLSGERTAYRCKAPVVSLVSLRLVGVNPSLKLDPSINLACMYKSSSPSALDACVADSVRKVLGQ